MTFPKPSHGSGDNGTRNQTRIQSTQRMNPVNNSAQSIDMAEDIICQCGTPAVLLTVRKEGPNTGSYCYYEFVIFSN